MASNYSAFKKIDHYVGLPICALLSSLYGIKNVFVKQKSASKPPKRILIIKFFGLGSIGYSTLIVRDLKRQYKDAHITLLTFDENRHFVELLGAYDSIIGIDKKNFFRFVSSTMKTLLTNFVKSYDMTIDIEFFSKYTAIHTAFTRAPKRIGFSLPKSFWRRYIYTDFVSFNIANHVRKIYGMISLVAGIERSEETPATIQVKQELISQASSKLIAAGWDKQMPIVGINVNASDLSFGRRWPIERFAFVTENLAKNGYFVGLTGAPDEREYTQTCIERISSDLRNRVANLAGVLNIDEFIGFFKLVKLFVTNDSGPMIFCILTDTPSVSLWGPTDPSVYGGQSKLHSVVYSKYPCSPCIYMPGVDAGLFCDKKFPCMDAIQKEQVLEEIMKRLEAV